MWPFSLFRRRTSASTTTNIVIGPGRRFQRIGGRTIDTTSSYALPNDLPENERLNLQHYIMRYALQGNYMVPFRQMKSGPTAILDVACGTGRWGAEMATEFPQANVVGIDIVQPDPRSPSVTLGKATPPENYVLMQGDIRAGLPFPDDSFDFVHMRFLVVAIAATDWPIVIREIVRVTRPGGWIELIDTVMRDAVGSPAHTTFFQWFEKMMASRGFDLLAGEHLVDRLNGAGLDHVKGSRVDIPIGEWGGRIGIMMRHDVEAAAQGIVAPVVKYGLATEEQAHTVVQEMGRAMKTKRGSIQPFYVAIAQKRMR